MEGQGARLGKRRSTGRLSRSSVSMEGRLSPTEESVDEEALADEFGEAEETDRLLPDQVRPLCAVSALRSLTPYSNSPSGYSLRRMRRFLTDL